MTVKKRYTIFNMYIRGSNQSAQACHALNNLWKAYNNKEFGVQASELFQDWAFKSEVEIMLQGGYHKDLEILYASLKNIPTIPSAKFNESDDALAGACTAITFVASERIVIANNYVRNNHLNPSNVVEVLTAASAQDLEILEKLTDDEIYVVSKIAFLPLAA